jgi:hypothetical protein
MGVRGEGEFSLERFYRERFLSPASRFFVFTWLADFAHNPPGRASAHRPLDVQRCRRHGVAGKR